MQRLACDTHRYLEGIFRYKRSSATRCFISSTWNCLPQAVNSSPVVLLLWFQWLPFRFCGSWGHWAHSVCSRLFLIALCLPWSRCHWTLWKCASLVSHFNQLEFCESHPTPFLFHTYIKLYANIQKLVHKSEVGKQWECTDKPCFMLMCSEASPLRWPQVQYLFTAANAELGGDNL